jgi:hypothetical protein
LNIGILGTGIFRLDHTTSERNKKAGREGARPAI